MVFHFLGTVVPLCTPHILVDMVVEIDMGTQVPSADQTRNNQPRAVVDRPHGEGRLKESLVFCFCSISRVMQRGVSCPTYKEFSPCFLASVRFAFPGAFLGAFLISLIQVEFICSPLPLARFLSILHV